MHDGSQVAEAIFLSCERVIVTVAWCLAVRGWREVSEFMPAAARALLCLLDLVSVFGLHGILCCHRPPFISDYLFPGPPTNIFLTQLCHLRSDLKGLQIFFKSHCGFVCGHQC
mmetsp:Transcript_47711/g.108178  ORF Transcript_47711/g.108178 Transcript_47711/m.108178 type:complete len:113 (+) Transcript_47711:2356-2694(+)